MRFHLLPSPRGRAFGGPFSLVARAARFLTKSLEFARIAVATGSGTLSAGERERNTTNGGRRGFLGWLLGTSVGALAASVVYPVARFLSPPELPEATTRQVEAGLVNDPELLEKGFKILRFGNEPVILVRLGEDQFRAFAGTCTHLDCIVEFHKEPRRIWCNCHNGEYDLQGRVVAGPPPRPLEVFRVDLVAKSSGQPKTVVVSRA